ncbi:MAG: glycosyltransferase [Gammaproteobacteria bacterium]
MDVITYSTLYPNEAQPRHGLFVQARLRELRQRHEVGAQVVAPVPWFPLRHPAFGRYAQFASAPRYAVQDDVQVHHPRYFLPPKIGMHIAPRTMARGSRRAVAACIERAANAPVLDAHYFYPDGVAAAHLAERFKLPLVISARGSDINLLPNDPAVRRRMLWAAERADALVAVSSALAERMVEIGMPAQKIEVLRNGVDLETFRVLDRVAMKRQLGFEGPLLLSVGNLYELKGHDLVIEALARHPEANLVVAGSGPELGALKACAERHKVVQRVHFVGSVAQSQLVQYYNAADALVLASSREGMANVLLEALACGTPVVVTPVGGNPEVVASAAAGIVLPERSAKAVADGIGAVFRAPPTREDTRAYAETFSWADVANRLYQLLGNVQMARA